MVSLLRNCVMTGALCATGDILSQSIDRSQAYNPYSTLRNSLYGFIVFGPIGHKLYVALDRVNPFKSSVLNLATRVALDQFLWAPIGVGLYLSSMSVMEGRSYEELKLKLNHVYWNVLVTNWTIWPAFQAINFTIIGTHYRLLAVNIASIAWNCYLSWKNRHSFDSTYNDEK